MEALAKLTKQWAIQRLTSEVLIFFHHGASTWHFHIFQIILAVSTFETGITRTACHPISPMKSTMAMSPCKECRIPTWPLVLNSDPMAIPVVVLPPKMPSCWVLICFTQLPGCTDVSCKVPRLVTNQWPPPKALMLLLRTPKLDVYVNIMSTHRNWYEMQLNKNYKGLLDTDDHDPHCIIIHYIITCVLSMTSWSIIVNGSCSLPLPHACNDF